MNFRTFCTLQGIGYVRKYKVLKILLKGSSFRTLRYEICKIENQNLKFLILVP